MKNKIQFDIIFSEQYWNFVIKSGEKGFNILNAKMLIFSYHNDKVIRTKK